MNFALIFAGGVGQRMNSGSLPKQFLIVHEKPIIVHTIEHFQNTNYIDKIVVVCVKDYIDYMNELKIKFALNKICSIIPGGDNGQESIFNGLVEINKIKESEKDIVLIHDGVRPIIDENTIKENIKCVGEKGTCITVSKSIETVLLVENENVSKVEDRKYCYMGRAPQSFYFKDIYEAHIKSKELGLHDFIDSAMLMQYFGYEMHTILGPDNNIKVTTPADYYMFKALLDAKENEQIRVL